MVEFAIVVLLLITLLYGIVTYGLILAAQATITQAAADAARSGLVASSSAMSVAEGEAANDVAWMGRGPCATSTSSSSVMYCTATEAPCPSDATSDTDIECLSVTVTYDYSSDPLFPELPGLGLITPSTLSSTNVVQMGTVS